MLSSWLSELQSFFDDRAATIGKDGISVEQLCYVSGRDPRLWADQSMYQDMIRSIQKQLELEPHHSLLEVGCAAGFLARGLAPLVGQYTGIDLSASALEVSRSLGLKNAMFKEANALHLPFPNDTFDRVACYDVVTNIPDFKTVSTIAGEMLRVTKPGGKVLLGSIPDQETEAEYSKSVSRVSADLEKRFGPLKAPESVAVPASGFLKLMRKLGPKRAQPRIVCYYFSKSRFLELGRNLGISAAVREIHQKNPYFGQRFNVVYSKDVV